MFYQDYIDMLNLNNDDDNNLRKVTSQNVKRMRHVMQMNVIITEKDLLRFFVKSDRRKGMNQYNEKY